MYGLKYGAKPIFCSYKQSITKTKFVVLVELVPSATVGQSVRGANPSNIVKLLSWLLYHVKFSNPY